MKYFNPSYWFKLWVLSAPLFNDKTQGINAKSIDNKNIKDWASKNTSDISLIENQELNLSNNQITLLNLPLWNTNLTTNNEHHKHRHQKRKNRNKRQNHNSELVPTCQVFAIDYKNNGYNEVISGCIANNGARRGSEYWGADFTPEFWEEIGKLQGSNNKDDFINKFNEKMWTGIYKPHSLDNVESMKTLAEKIWDNWENLNKYWQLSNKRKRVRICLQFERNFWRTKYFSKSEICFRNGDTISYRNKYLDFLESVFPDWNKEKINLGLINDNNDNDIKNVIKQKYSNFDILQIEIIDKVDYSNFSKDYKSKIMVNGNSKDYSHGLLKPELSYITKSKINELNSIIENDKNFKQWITHIKDYNKNLPTKIEQLKNYTNSQKWGAKNTEKEIIKGYIRDWSYINTLFEHELKLDELNKNIQGLKSNFDSIKNQINELDNRIINLENTNNWNCANIGGIVTTASAPVPVIGTIASTLSGLIAGSCAIAGV